MDETQLENSDLPLLSEWFDAYQRLGGTHLRERFAQNLRVFFMLTRDAFTGGPSELSREESYAEWKNYLKKNKSKRPAYEASLYFEAVDQITTYS